MINYVVGDLFTSPAKVLVNTVNTVGVMGKGIARDFKRCYPEMFEEYQYYCESGLFDIGKLWLYKTPHKWILNFPTKKHWRNKSKIEYIQAGLTKFADTYDAKGLTSISFPMLGCGNGELDWAHEVRPLMEEILKPLPIEVYVHLYRQNLRFMPEHRDIGAIKDWLRTEPHHLPFAEFWDDVIALVKSRSSVQTFDLKSKFDAMYVRRADTLVIKSSSSMAYLHRESFEYLWAAIRPIGYFRYRDFPEDMSAVTRELVSLLSQLPYIELIHIANSATISDHDVGIKLHATSSRVKAETLQVKSA